MKKYELTDETIDVSGTTLHRIKAKQRYSYNIHMLFLQFEVDFYQIN